MNKLSAAAFSFIAFFSATLGVYLWSNIYTQGSLLPDILYIISAAIAVAGGVYATRVYGTHTPRGVAFAFITGALGMWLIGEIIWLYYYYTDINPFPSLADVFYLLAYPLFLFGMFKEFRTLSVRWKDLTSFLKAGIGVTLAAGAGMFLYYGILPSIDEKADLATNLISSAYSAGDIVLTGAALLLILLITRYRTGKISQSWKHLLAAFVLTLVADVVYMFAYEAYDAGEMIVVALDGLWIASYLFFAYSFLTAANLATSVKNRLTT